MVVAVDQHPRFCGNQKSRLSTVLRAGPHGTGPVIDRG